METIRKEEKNLLPYINLVLLNLICPALQTVSGDAGQMASASIVIRSDSTLLAIQLENLNAKFAYFILIK